MGARPPPTPESLIVFCRPAGPQLDSLTCIPFAILLKLQRGNFISLCQFPSTSLPLSVPTKPVPFVIFGKKDVPSVDFTASEKQLKEAELGRGIWPSYLCVCTHTHTPVELSWLKMDPCVCYFVDIRNVQTCAEFFWVYLSQSDDNFQEAKSQWTENSLWRMAFAAYFNY